MLLDPEVCYRALRSRDARFDGRIFVGVLSTGVYCRPICPARTPRKRNVRFFACAAAAAEAGFRPCLRCRPEASPATPAWLGTSATVSRALRLIAEGALDSEGVESLAARMGIGERHLRRLFDAHLGASPVAVAQTRRVHFAKKLIDETGLPMAEVAFAAGFSSIRRFNSTMRSVYGTSPTQLRQRARGTRAIDRRAELELRLPYRSPFDWDGIVGFLAPRATPGVEVATASSYRRAVSLAGTEGVIEVRPSPSRASLLLRVDASLSGILVAIVERVRRLFDLAAEPGEIARHLGRDAWLARRLRARPGLRVPGAWDGFELAVRAILGQQVSVSGATTLAGRLVATWGTPLRSPRDGLDRLFPAPEVLAEADLASIGLPAARAAAIRDLARAVSKGEFDLDGPQDLDATIARLVALRGVGPWTAQYVAMRALRHPDAFPSSDLGLRRALADGGAAVSPRELERRAEAWRPWRAYAAMTLWAGSRAQGAGRARADWHASRRAGAVRAHAGSSASRIGSFPKGS